MLYRAEIYRNTSEIATITVEARNEDEAYDKAFELAESPKFKGWTMAEFDAEVGAVEEIGED